MQNVTYTVSLFWIFFFLTEGLFLRASTDGSPQMIISSWPLFISSVGNRTISFSTKSSILFIGLRSNFSLFDESTVRNSKLCTAAFESGSIFTTFVMGHLFLHRSSFSNTMSPASKSRFFVFHFCRIWMLLRNLFLQRDQNSSVICWIQLYLRRDCKSGLSKIPGGGKITLVVCVSRLLGEMGIWILTSLSVSTVSALELMIPSVSANRVLKFSSIKLHEWVLSKASSIVLAVWI